MLMWNLRSGRLIAICLLSLAFTACTSPEWRLTVNPYQAVNWQQDERHHGNFHTHTTESDGRQHPAEVIDGYHEIGHDVLALTDHNKYTWPWQAFGRDPEELDMLAIPGNELSRHHHTLSLFSDLETQTTDHETAIQQVHGIGGISVLAHPGRYWELDKEGQVPDAVRDKYAHLFKAYDSLVGMEVINQGDRYPADRALWDALLVELMPDRPVWGMANDDSHGKAQIGLNTTVMLLPAFDEGQVRAALEQGRYYFTTLTSHPADERGRDQTPVIRNIVYDEQAGTLSIEADSGGEPVPAERYQWISAGGKIVHRGPNLDLRRTKDLDIYVRVEIRGDGGTAYTQPFGIERQ